jgi:hypothetical protein
VPHLSIPHPSKTIRDRMKSRFLERHRSSAPIRLTVPHFRGEIDLGTYPSRSAAMLAYAAVLPHLASPDPWPAIWDLQSRGVVAPDAYPTHVRAVVEGGRIGYVGKQRVGGDEVETSRLFQSPNSAHVTLGKSVRSLEAKLEAERTWVRRRFPRDPDLPKYLRFTKGNALHARPWVQIFPQWEVGVNLGLWSRNLFGGDRHSQIAFARHAAFTFIKLFCGPPKRDVWGVIQQMQGMRHMGLQLVRGHVLPPRVRRTNDGRFVGRVRRDGNVVWESPLYDTPVEAWDAVKAHKKMESIKRCASTSGGSRCREQWHDSRRAVLQVQ